MTPQTLREHIKHTNRKQTTKQTNKQTNTNTYQQTYTNATANKHTHTHNKLKKNKKCLTKHTICITTYTNKNKQPYNILWYKQQWPNIKQYNTNTSTRLKQNKTAIHIHEPMQTIKFWKEEITEHAHAQTLQHTRTTTNNNYTNTMKHTCNT